MDNHEEITNNTLKIKLSVLISQAMNGDVSVSKEIYDVWYKKLFQYFMRRLRNYEASLDCISDVFVKLYSSNALVSPDMNIDPYLYSVAYSVLIDFTRKKKPTISLDDEEGSISESSLVDKNTNIENQIDRRLSRSQLDTCLKTLSSVDREIINLRIFEEKEYSEISEIIDMKVDAVRKAYSRALVKLESVYVKLYKKYE